MRKILKKVVYFLILIGAGLWNTPGLFVALKRASVKMSGLVVKQDGNIPIDYRADFAIYIILSIDVIGRFLFRIKLLANRGWIVYA